MMTLAAARRGSRISEAAAQQQQHSSRAHLYDNIMTVEFLKSRLRLLLHSIAWHSCAAAKLTCVNRLLWFRSQ